jgi:putative transposase
MQLESGYIYHIFNQGNNRQNVFFCRDNYLFFLKKIKMYITPYADILAWCLMPNHFHMMVYVRDDRERDTNLECDSKSRPELVVYDLNKSIGILLSSYTQVIRAMPHYLIC